MLQELINDPSINRVEIPPGEWRVSPLSITRTGLTLHLQAGASLIAKRGVYAGTDTVIKLPRSATLRPSNITIEGEGPTSVIGFDDDETYQGEHRHAIGVFNSDDVRIANLKIQNTYGDGITVGDDGETDLSLKRCRRVTLEDLQIDRASRNGVAWVSCEDFTARRISVTNVGPIAPGVAPTGPWAGLDIEPDQSEQSLSGVIEDFSVDGCDGSGILLELASAACDQDENLMSVAISDVSISNAGGAGIRIVNAFSYLKGSILVENLETNLTGRAGIAIRDKSADGPTVVIDGCEISLANQGMATFENTAPVVVYKQTADLDYPLWRDDCGNVELRDVAAVANLLPKRADLIGRSDGFVVRDIIVEISGDGTVGLENTSNVTVL